MRVAGIHTYFGGFLHGLMRTKAQVICDYESWRYGILSARASDLPVIDFKTLPKNVYDVDLVVSNPPCSRFSNFTKSGSFNDCQRTDLNTFRDLLDAVELTERSGARALWWETGPLFWNRGRQMVDQVHSRLSTYWPNLKTLLIKYDPRYSGIPQRRPRCHILCVDSKHQPRYQTRLPWLPEVRLGQWVDEKVAGFSLDMPCVRPGSNWQLKNESVKDFIKFTHLIATYQSSRPALVDEGAEYSPGIVSRSMAWIQRNRWFDLLELAALMDYPLDITRRAFERLDCRHKASVGIMLLSKSVSPAATETIYNDVLEPWVEGRPGLYASAYAENKYELVLYPE